MPSQSRSEFTNYWEAQLDIHLNTGWSSFYESKGKIISDYDKDSLAILRHALGFLTDSQTAELAELTGHSVDYLVLIHENVVVAGNLKHGKEFTDWLFNRDIAFYQAHDKAAYEFVFGRELPAGYEKAWSDYIDQTVSYRSNMSERRNRVEDLVYILPVLKDLEVQE